MFLGIPAFIANMHNVNEVSYASRNMTFFIRRHVKELATVYNYLKIIQKKKDPSYLKKKKTKMPPKHCFQMPFYNS